MIMQPQEFHIYYSRIENENNEQTIAARVEFFHKKYGLLGNL